VTNEATDAYQRKVLKKIGIKNKHRRPTDACEIVTSEPTVAREIVTNEPEVRENGR
jgi:hypothetical protein